MAKYEGGYAGLTGIGSGNTYLFGEPIPDWEFEKDPSLLVALPMLVESGMIARCFVDHSELEELKKEIVELKKVVAGLNKKKSPGRPPKTKKIDD